MGCRRSCRERKKFVAKVAVEKAALTERNVIYLYLSPQFGHLGLFCQETLSLVLNQQKM